MDFHNIVTIYWLLFLVGFIFTALSGLLSGIGGHGFGGHDLGGHGFGGHVGMGHDVGGHVGIAHGGVHGAPAHGVTPSGSADLYQPQGEVPLSPVNFLTIAAFVMGFGGGGIIGTALQPITWITLIIAFVVGYVMAFGVYHFMVFLNRNVGSSEALVSEIIGTSAEVITPIVEDAVGEIAYVARGSRYQAPARSIDSRSIQRGRPVKIWRLVGNTYYVKEILPEEVEHPADNESVPQ